MDIHKSEETKPLEVDPVAQKFRDGVLKFRQEYDELCIKHGMAFKVIIDFPQYNILPPEVQLSVMVIQKNGGVFTMKPTPIEKVEEKVEKKEGEE